VTQESFSNMIYWVIRKGYWSPIFWPRRQNSSFWVEWYAISDISGKLRENIRQNKIQTKWIIFISFQKKMEWPERQRWEETWHKKGSIPYHCKEFIPDKVPKNPDIKPCNTIPCFSLLTKVLEVHGFWAWVVSFSQKSPDNVK